MAELTHLRVDPIDRHPPCSRWGALIGTIHVNSGAAGYVFMSMTVGTGTPRKPRRVLIMDPHFNEYLAAVAGMHDIYGELPADAGTEFHAIADELAATEAAEAVAVA